MNVLNKEKNNQRDWHRADIIAALHKKGWSIRQLAFKHGYAGSSSLSQALYRPFPKGERIIANAIGIPPEQIWPTRFQERKLKESRMFG